MSSDFTYVLRISRRSKHLRLTVDPDGGVVVSAPNSVPAAMIENFVAKHRDWIEKRLAYIKKIGPSKFPRLSARQRIMEYTQYKHDALVLVQARLQEFNTLYNFSYKHIAIRNQKTRWGSCSAKGNLSFNYKIALLPSHLADYIVVHELCHLGEFNHSNRFWSLVARTIPDYTECKKALRAYRP